MSQQPPIGTPIPARPVRCDPVLHLVGRVTDDVASFLGPATHALAEAGAPQTVILVDDEVHESALHLLHPSAHLVRLPAHGSQVNQVLQLRNALLRMLAQTQFGAVHLHGLLPSLIGVSASSSAAMPRKVYFSPHGSKLLFPFKALGGLLLWFMRPLSGHPPQRAIANIGADVRALQALTQQSVELIESPVAPVFFSATHKEAATPKVVSGHHAHDDATSIPVIAQMAVLLCDETHGARFSWIGQASPKQLAQLKAAHIKQVDAPLGTQRADEMSDGWLYYAPAGARGFPVRLAEAMALGLPCVAFDTPYHRDLIRHGETGLLCRNADEALTAISQLIASQPLRRRIGAAAREEALRRFNPVKFRTSLLAAYEEA